MTFKQKFFGSGEGPSDPGTLNVTDWKKIGRGALFAAGGSVVAYLLSILPGLNLGHLSGYGALIVPLCSVLLNLAQKYFSGQ